MKIASLLVLTTMALVSGTEGPRNDLSSNNSGPILVDHGPALVQQPHSILEKPIIIDQAIAPAHSPYSNEAPIVLDHNFGNSAVVPHIEVPVAPVTTCARCQCVTCCCKPKLRRRVAAKPKLESTFCLVDPLGCSHEACVRVPACCVGEVPEVTWNRGLLGRRVAKLCWACCDHEVKVVVTRKGKVKVRD